MVKKSENYNYAKNIQNVLKVIPYKTMYIKLSTWQIFQVSTIIRFLTLIK